MLRLQSKLDQEEFRKQHQVCNCVPRQACFT